MGKITRDRSALVLRDRVRRRVRAGTDTRRCGWSRGWVRCWRCRDRVAARC